MTQYIDQLSPTAHTAYISQQQSLCTPGPILNLCSMQPHSSAVTLYHGPGANHCFTTGGHLGIHTALPSQILHVNSSQSKPSNVVEKKVVDNGSNSLTKNKHDSTRSKNNWSASSRRKSSWH